MTPDPDSFTALAESAERLALLEETAAAVFVREWSPSASRTIVDADGTAWAPELWEKLVELGWRDVLVPESGGGSGGSVAELCVLAEQAGAALAPVPLVPAAVAAACTGVAPSSGITVVVPDCEFTVERSSDGWAFTGTSRSVPYADVADTTVVFGIVPDGTTVLAEVDLHGPGVKRIPLVPMDHVPAADLDFSRARCEPSGAVTIGEEAISRWRSAVNIHLLGLCAELVGVAAAANAAAVDYAKERIAFGRPIGAFQAIKHRLVDQRATIEVERALLSRAADAVAADAEEASALVHLAAFWAASSLRQVPEGAVQVFGGIGYTWEHDAHLYLRRAAVLTALLGARSEHRDAVGEWLAVRQS